MIQFLRATLQHMAEAEMLSMLRPGEIDRIKAAGDESPLIRVFAIGHEGEASPVQITSMGKIRVTLQYLRDAVKRIAGSLALGVPVFSGHDESNSSENRRIVGQVVGKAIKEIGGKLYALAAIHIFPAFRKETFDIASFEADCTYVREGGDLKVTDIEPITGIALASSAAKTPAFPGATLRGAFQCFAETLAPPGGDTMPLSLSDIQEAVQKLGVVPSRVFSLDQIRSDPAISAEKKEQDKKTDQGYKDRLTDQLKERTKGLNEELDKAKEKIKELQKTNLSLRATSIFDGVAVTRKLSEQQVAFCRTKIGAFSSDAENEEEVKTAMNTFVDDRLKEMKEVAKIFGVETEDETPEGDDSKDKKPGAPPASTVGREGDSLTPDALKAVAGEIT